MKTVRTDRPYGPSVRIVRTVRPYGSSVRTVRTDRPYGLSVRTVRTDCPYGPSVWTVRTDRGKPTGLGLVAQSTRLIEAVQLELSHMGMVFGALAFKGFAESWTFMIFV